MFPEENTGKGYGTEALELIIHQAKSSGKYDFFILNCAFDNKRGGHVYEKVGFQDTGEVENGESVPKRVVKA